MKNYYLTLLTLFIFTLTPKCFAGFKVVPSPHDLKFNQLSKTWDEGIPLGNSIVGSIVWKKNSSLRLSLDRVDLWDLRPIDSISGKNNTFDWVYQQVQKNDYLPVQKKFDHPYDQLPAPSKIPGAGLEFKLNSLGDPQSVELFLNNALCEVKWKSGTHLQTFVHPVEPIGWFCLENASSIGIPELIPPAYNKEGALADLGPVGGLDLRRLGYEQGKVVEKNNLLVYHQKGWGDYYYDVAVKWERRDDKLIGVWAITSSLVTDKAVDKVNAAFKRGMDKDYAALQSFWKEYWSQSSISIPDKVLEKQYANEMYKLGSIARENSYPISLQSVWTADNGNLPPWKGDYHHDLNTQLSYWPCYIGNHLKEGMGYLNTLWNQRGEYKKYTKQYFGTEGMNVPGVCTLQGVPMGGWIQYAMSPTAGAWLSQHFYLHYKYSADKVFLKEKAYPFVKDVVTYLEQFTKVDEKGTRKLPLSSSPEIYDNSIEAWFKDMTNYDLGLVRFVFKAASELAADLNLTEEANHWKAILSQFQDYDVDSHGGLTFAKGFPYNESHRHFSNSIAIHPLGVIDWSNGDEDQKIIKETIANLDKYGPDYWCGYSYSWFGNLKARAFDGDGAAKALRTFAECFCLKNTFHANGDQSKSGKSKFTYRPFTLEGNLAFAAGIQEMLLQSHSGVIRVFPAIPKSWDSVSFDKLRAYGAFIISAEKKDAKVVRVKVFSEKGGLVRILNPFVDNQFSVIGAKIKQAKGNILTVEMKPGQQLLLLKK